MRVLVTGTTGFVGRWLTTELESAGHLVIPTPPSAELSIDDAGAITAFIASADADAVVHLAAVAHVADAAADPRRAVQINVGGAAAVFGACAGARSHPVALAVSSSEVYGNPDPDDLPLSEAAPLRPRHVYGATKLALEATAAWLAREHGVPVAVVRPFNHTGPGQRPDFVVPGFVERVRSVAEGRATEVRTGNVDVHRDITDVRDVARAYRLLIERLVADRPTEAAIFNVASGVATRVGDIVETLCRLFGVTPSIVRDADLVRLDDPPAIVGDASRLFRYVGWRPTIPLSETLADMVRRLEPAQSPDRTRVASN